MTVAVLVKVWDGLVFATDSASSMVHPSGPAQVYNNGDKIFHLHRELPIGAMTWGLGNIGAASIATLAKDLRARLMGLSSAHKGWALDPETYTIQEVAQRLVEHFFHDLYAPHFSAYPEAPGLGMLVGGYSANERQSEAWLVTMHDPNVEPTPVPAIGTHGTGWRAYAQSQAVERLWYGLDQDAMDALEAGLDAEEIEKVRRILIGASITRAPVQPAMPLADAIELAQYKVDVTSGYTHFLFGPDTVGGPTEVASISRHENFKWIARKHYYNRSLNPREPGHAS
ncbi:MAG: hypothetical protein WA892_06745 [Ornithinimicrobium sp.]